MKEGTPGVQSTNGKYSHDEHNHLYYPISDEDSTNTNSNTNKVDRQLGIQKDTLHFAKVKDSDGKSRLYRCVIDTKLREFEKDSPGEGSTPERKKHGWKIENAYTHSHRIDNGNLIPMFDKVTQKCTYMIICF